MSQDTNGQEQQGISQPHSQEENEAQYRASDSETKAGGESVETPEVSRSLSRSLSASTVSNWTSAKPRGFSFGCTPCKKLISDC